jgi:type II secretory pathway component PulM
VSGDEQQSRTRKVLTWMATILPLILLWLWLGRPLVDRLLG